MNSVEKKYSARTLFQNITYFVVCFLAFLRLNVEIKSSFQAAVNFVDILVKYTLLMGSHYAELKSITHRFIKEHLKPVLS